MLGYPGVINEIDRYLRIGEQGGPLSSVEDGKFGQGVLLPNVYFVDPGTGVDSNDGRDPRRPLATLQAAIDLCVANRGDIIVVQRGGGEEVTSTVAFNKAGITVIGQQYGVSPLARGEYFSILAADTFTDGPVATITSPCTIIGLGFVSRDTGPLYAAGAAMLIGGLAGADNASPFGVHIKDCRFPKWGLDNRIGIALDGSSNCLIEDCDFEGVTQDFDSGIYVQGALQNLTVRRCHFRSCTYGILCGTFSDSGDPHLMIGPDNVFEDGKVFSGSATTTGIVFGNYSEGLTDGGSYNVTVDTLNGYGVVISGMHYFE